VFYGLLLEECDRQQQADYLQLCLQCWGHTTGAAKAPAGAGHAGLASDAAIISKLAEFVERQHCLSAGAIIDMLTAEPGGIGRAGALRLCDALLARAAGGGGGSGGASQPELSRAVELMVRYVRLSCEAAADGVREELQQQGPGGGGGSGSAVAAAGAKPQRGGAAAAAAAAGGPRQRRAAAAARRAADALASRPARAAASAALAAASLAGGHGLALRAARLLPLLVLLHAAQHKPSHPQDA
jgi:hypothetical protein